MESSRPSLEAQRNPFLKTSSGHEIQLAANRVYVLGRSETCDLRLDDQACSRRHARILVAGDGRTVHLEDLESKNGTFRNNRPLEGRVQLGDGDVIQFGASHYTIHIPRGGMAFEFDTKTNVRSR